MEQKLKMYAKLKLQEKSIKAQYEVLQAEIIEHVQENPDKKLETKFGKFKVTERATWKYSEDVDKQKAKMVKLQEKEQATGVATKTVKASLTFTQPKEK